MGSDHGVPYVPARAAGPQVLHAIPTGLGRGAQIFARALVDELGGLESGHRLVSLFDGEHGVEVDDTLGLPGGPSAAVGLHFAAVTTLASRLRRFEHDVVVAHGGDAFKYLALSSRSPLVYCVIGTWPSSARRGARRLAWTALARRAWMAAAVSDDVARDCREMLSIRPDRVAMIPNGRDDTRFVPKPRPAGGPVTLLFVGRLISGKRPQLFLRLLERLRADGYPVFGRMVGAGPMDTGLRARAAKADVEMFGSVARCRAAPARARIFLSFPTAPDGEGMPGVLIEAGLCGIPAVATRVAGASTVIQDDRPACSSTWTTSTDWRTPPPTSSNIRTAGWPWARRRGAAASGNSLRGGGGTLGPAAADHPPAPASRRGGRRDAPVTLMCGIAGLLDPTGARDGELGHLASAMASALVHREPDDFGLGRSTSAGLALAHRRLEVVGKGAQGRQPMRAGDWVLNYNGELYNTSELRADLGAGRRARARLLRHRSAGGGTRYLGAGGDAGTSRGHVRLRGMGCSLRRAPSGP